MRFAVRFGIFLRRLETEIRIGPVPLGPLGLALLLEPPLLRLRRPPPPLFGKVCALKIGWKSSGHPCWTRAVTLRPGPADAVQVGHLSEDYSVSAI